MEVVILWMEFGLGMMFLWERAEEQRFSIFLKWLQMLWVSFLLNISGLTVSSWV